MAPPRGPVGARREAPGEIGRSSGLIGEGTGAAGSGTGSLFFAASIKSQSVKLASAAVVLSIGSSQKSNSE